MNRSRTLMLLSAVAVAALGCGRNAPNAAQPSATTPTTNADDLTLNPVARGARATTRPSSPPTSATTTTTALTRPTGEKPVVYPDGMGCVDASSTTVTRSWSLGQFPPTPNGEPGRSDDPGPLQVYAEQPTTVGGHRFDILSVGCGKLVRRQDPDPRRGDGAPVGRWHPTQPARVPRGR